VVFARRPSLMEGTTFSKSWPLPSLLIPVILCCSFWGSVQCRLSAAAQTPLAQTPLPQPSPTPVVPAFFIFGDSLVDVGNNNYIGSLARSNFFPNGIDFPGGIPTGRFCNGKLVLDFISKHQLYIMLFEISHGLWPIGFKVGHACLSC
jgi:hypothetical protein